MKRSSPIDYNTIFSPATVLKSFGSAVDGTLPLDGSGMRAMVVRVTATAAGFVRMSSSQAPVTATKNDTLIQPGDFLLMRTAGMDYVSFISDSASATCTISPQEWGGYVTGTVVQFSPAMLFTGTTTGAWYDPSDLTTLYCDAAGTTPVTAVEQPVGLMLDKSKGLVLGPELVTNGDFSNGTTGWTQTGGYTPTVSGGALVFNGGSSTGGVYQTLGGVGKVYQITYTITAYTAGAFKVSIGTTYGPLRTAAGTYTETRLAIGDNLLRIYGESTTFVGSVDNISVRELPGNHAFNNSGNSANFPVLSARYNLLTKTEQFDDAVWTKSQTTAPSVSVTNPIGGALANKLTEDTTNATHSVGQYISASAGSCKITVYAKQAGRQRLVFVLQDSSKNNGCYAVINLNTVNVDVDATLFGAGFNNGSASATSVGNGWVLCTLTATVPATTIGLSCQLDNATSGPLSQGYLGNGTDGIYIWGADLRVANDALNLPAYQRVNTSTDYDTVGFKPAEVFDGVDDNLIASAGGGSTTAFFWCSAIRVGKVGAVQTLFSDAGANTGYRVRINASNQLELSAGNGTAYTTVATTATLSIGQRAVLTAWHDGTNLNVQINNGTVHQAAFATATAGTAQFTIGKDNNAASNFFAGRLYEKVYTKDNVPSSAQITSTKTYVANVAGITL